MKKLHFIVFLVLIIACNKEEIFSGPNSYSDDFEEYDSIDELIDGENQKWSFFQNTLETNDICIDSSNVHSGTKSVKCIAKKTIDILSKSSINKQEMAFFENDIVFVDFWIYLEGNKDAQWLFIFDLEEKTPIGAGPGIRLALVDGKITVEHKYLNPNIFQEDAGINFPRDQWVNIQFESLLSQKKNGYLKVFQDGSLIIEQQNWKTLPTDFLYSTQGTQGMYNQIEFGITANPSDDDLTLYVDDISIEIIN